jgi:hypothetical protein
MLAKVAKAHLSRASMVDTRARFPGPPKKSSKLIFPNQSWLFKNSTRLDAS